ncbi:hypothetical protein AX17_005563 [Amanita inopinata Kibby_2008]|nr:hypothetical protein AX17_005563 [Amanita inopinata Kibby_2008]
MSLLSLKTASKATTQLATVHYQPRCSLHCSTACHKQALKFRASARTRLTKDLKPTTKAGHLEVARDHRTRFARDPAPHTEPGVTPIDERTHRRRPRPTARYHAQSNEHALSTDNAKASNMRSRTLWSERVPKPAEDVSQWAQSSSAKIRGMMPMFNELHNPPGPATVADSRKSGKGHKALTTTDERLPTKFTSPPLMPGFVTCLNDMLGRNATPTPIQALSVKWLLDQNGDGHSSQPGSSWKQFLLASETGSGKSIAYLLPVLQHLKQGELQRQQQQQTQVEKQDSAVSEFDLNPRALILAPTHELSRQLSTFAKALLHEVKLRVLCASRANVKNSRDKDASAKKMVSQFEGAMDKSKAPGMSADVDIRRKDGSVPVDVVVGTPMKLLEMVRGRGWNREEDEAGENGRDRPTRRDPDAGKGKPEMGLANVEWIVVDEADVLFDPDFQEYTRMLLADISAARGTPVAYTPESALSASALAKADNSALVKSSDVQPLNYPFNLVLTTATIPAALSSYLDRHHPNLIRLASPNLHHLPKTLRTEYVAWSGGNKFADVERRIRQVWADDSAAPSQAPASGTPPLSKVLIFCNKSTKVEELGEYLAQQRIKNIALTSTSEERKRGSNRHLEGFLRPTSSKEKPAKSNVNSSASVRGEPHVMITTSLLSRGLDFSPEIRHVFIVDEPRNMIDFLHRAGRSGRAGEKGKVVVFGKMKGRGSAKAKEVKKRVGALVA